MPVLDHVQPERKLAGLPSMRYYDLRRAAGRIVTVWLSVRLSNWLVARRN